MDMPLSQKLLAHCPVCRTAYSPKGIRLVGEKGMTKVFHCSCTSCKHAVLAVILETPGAVSTVGMVTDLELQDALRFKDMAPVSADEVLQLHMELEHEAQAWGRRLLDKKA